MKQKMSRLSLGTLAFVATTALAQAQAPTTPIVPPQGGTPMAGMMGDGEKAGSMGGMESMMERMRPMMAGRGEMGMPFEHIEGRIAYLRAELKITDAQTVPWNAFAEAMRANAAAMKGMHGQMTGDGMAATLPDRLAARQKMMSAHIGRLNRMETAAKPLYAALSAEQRKLLDQLTASPMGMM